MAKNGGVQAGVIVATAIVGVAMFALAVSRNSKTADLIQAIGSSFANALGVAIAPITGASYHINS